MRRIMSTKQQHLLTSNYTLTEYLCLSDQLASQRSSIALTVEDMGEQQEANRAKSLDRYLTTRSAKRKDSDNNHGQSDNRPRQK